MPYTKDPIPVGASVEELVRYYDGELEKIQQLSSEHEAMLEAIDIIGISATWFWDDGLLGEPAPGFMRGNNNAMFAMTQIKVNLIDAQRKNVEQLLKTSIIKEGDLLGLINISGLGGGNYNVSGPVAFFATHIEIPVETFQGQSGNPVPDDVMAMRWEFATAPGLFQI